MNERNVVNTCDMITILQYYTVFIVIMHIFIEVCYDLFIVCHKIHD